MTSTIHLNLRVPFGLKQGRMVAPEEVDRGRACGCTCPGCGTSLIAKKGEEVVWHFSHDGAACESGAETAIHLMAKQILAEERRVALPAVIVSMSATDAYGREQTLRKLLAPAVAAQYENVVLEVTRGGRRPDAVGSGGNTSVEHRIEVFVRHAVDEAKARELEDEECACFEICLNDLKGVLSKDALRTAVINSSERIKWISYPGQLQAKAELSRQLEVLLNDARQRKEAEDAVKREDDNEEDDFYAGLAEERQEARRKFQKEEQLRKQQAAQRAQQKALANANFKAATEDEKRAFVLNKLRISGDTVPPMLDSSVRGDKSFGVSRSVWQADVFRTVIFNRFDGDNDELSLESVFNWLQLRYHYTPQFADSGKVALWDYLAALENLGYVKHVGRQRFKVLKDDAPWLEVAGEKTLQPWYWTSTRHSLNWSELQNANAKSHAPLRPSELTALFRRVQARHRIEEPEDITRTVAQRTGRNQEELLTLLSKVGVVTCSQGWSAKQHHAFKR